MAKLIETNLISDDRGHLVVLQDQIPFDIQRIFYVFGVDQQKRRGGHRHKKTRMALVAVHGSCVISTNNGRIKHEYRLDQPNKILFLEPEDFHYMFEFSKDCVLVVLASTKYDKDDYITEDYAA